MYTCFKCDEVWRDKDVIHVCQLENHEVIVKLEKRIEALEIKLSQLKDRVVMGELF